MTVCCERAVEAPVETTVAILVPEDTAEETAVTADLTEDMPTVAVESDEEVRSQMLASVETCAEVEPAVVFDCAVESRVARLVTDDSNVDSDWVPDKATLCAAEIEFATEANVDVLTAWLTFDDWVVDSRVETLASRDTSRETTLETEVAAERTAEFEVPSEVAAEVIADVETVALIRTTVLRNDEIWVDAKVAMLVTEERPEDVLVSADRLLETAVWSAEIWLAAVDAPVEAAFWFRTAVDTPVLASVTCDRTVEIPTFAVESEVDRLLKALSPEDTWALVGVAASATIVDSAVEKSTASEVVPERLVLSRVAPDRAVDTTTPAEVVVDRAVDVIPERDVWLDKALLEADESAVFSDRLLETCVACEVCAEISLEIVEETVVLLARTVDTDEVFVSPTPSTTFRTLVSG
jgi:hypothetical protein